MEWSHKSQPNWFLWRRSLLCASDIAYFQLLSWITFITCSLWVLIVRYDIINQDLSRNGKFDEWLSQSWSTKWLTRWSAWWHSVPYLFCQSEYWSAVAEGSLSDYHSSSEQWYLCSESIRVGRGQFTSFESGQKEEKIKQLNYSEIIYSCYTSYYAFLCMKMAVFFNHLDDLKESKHLVHVFWSI